MWEENISEVLSAKCGCALSTHGERARTIKMSGKVFIKGGRVQSHTCPTVTLKGIRDKEGTMTASMNVAFRGLREQCLFQLLEANACLVQ